ncbi:hypothetical protein PCASD_11811 [Puccinia coronata f. sp. avenae]|uniref:F-box domain-containing protein n=1 Tax=Puccinia coronata f. sp. avenae TaxID=200324 RepID=A0A2N5UK45_9BASI|nr:hypothetical protein PCASD_11811 [Puccinia coronata f. sp. avenae]
MSFKPSKKQLAKRAAAAPTITPTIPSPSEDPPDRPRKSFFSFKAASSKRSTSRPAPNHEPSQNSGTVQFPVGSEKNLPVETHPPFKLDIPARNIRSSLLFSQQFDFNKVGIQNEPLHHDPSPTPLPSDTLSRPLRPAGRPASWMMMKDGSFAPPAKAQAQSRLKPAECSPESFYTGHRGMLNRLETSDTEVPLHDSPQPASRNPPPGAIRQPQQESFHTGHRGMSNRLETSDKLVPLHGSPQPVSWIRQPGAVRQPQQQPAMLGNVFPDSLQAHPAPPPAVASSAAPARLQPPLPIYSQSNLRPALPPSSPQSVSSTTSPQSSTYSPLAAFLGQANKPIATSAPRNTAAVPASTPHVPRTTPSSSLLSAFLGSPPAPEDSNKIPAASPPMTRLSSNSSILPPKAASNKDTSMALLNVQSTELSSLSSQTPASERFSWVGGSLYEVTPANPPQPTLLSSGPPSPVGISDTTVPKTLDSINATDETPSPKDEPAPELETVAPPAIPDPTPPGPPSSTPYHSGSVPSQSTCHSRQPSSPRTSSMAVDSASSYSSNKPRSVKNGGSRKRSVEKVYLDSSSQHSSSSSDNYSSNAAKDRNSQGTSDLSGVVTDPSSACSNSSSPSTGMLEKYKHRHQNHLESVQDVLQQDESKSEVPEPGNEGEVEKDISNGEISDQVDEEVEPHDETVQQKKVNFEQLASHPNIFRKIISHLDYLDFFSLSQISPEFHEELEDDPRLREIIMKRYLSGFGYRTLPAHLKVGQRTRELVAMDLKDLASFYAGLEFESLELIGYAKQALNRRGLDYRTAKMIRSSTRAYNKLVAYVRALEELDPPPPNQHRSATYRYAGRSDTSVYRAGKAALFKVWVPSADHWMSNEELAECERELWRSQVWSYLKKGDVCWNTAIGDFGNEGKLLFDGRFLRDLLFEFDEVGHLPSWLNMLNFPPSYFHKIISSSTSSPIFYLDLSNFKEEIRSTLRLNEDKIEVASPQARYRVKRWVYQSVIKIPKGHWQGYVVIEVDGTSEHAKDLLRRCGLHDPSKKPTPWRIIREKSRPGKLWIRPVNDDERRT